MQSWWRVAAYRAAVVDGLSERELEHAHRRYTNFGAAIAAAEKEGVFILTVNEYNILRCYTHVMFHACFCVRDCCQGAHADGYCLFMFDSLLRDHQRQRCDSNHRVHAEPVGQPPRADLDAADEVADAIAAMPIDAPPQ